MIKSLPLTLESVVKSAKAVTPSKNPSTLWPKLFLIIDLFAEQGGICAVTKTTYCTLDNTPREVEAHLRKITEQAPWLKSDPFCGVFV